MARFNGKWTPTFIIAVVLVLGLVGATAALLKASPQEAGTAGEPLDDEQPAAHVVVDDVDDEKADMPRTLPMPERESGDKGLKDDVVGADVTGKDLRGLLADAFGVEVDVSDAEATVTRADVAVAIVRALGLEDVAEAHAPTEFIFRDVAPEHEAFAAIAMLERLGLYPFHVGTLFAPDESVQRAEAQFTVETAAALEAVEGPIVHVNAPARTVSVEWTPRHATAYVAGEGTLIVRNGEPVPLERLRSGDDVRVVADADGDLFLAVAVGEQTEGGVSDELLTIVRELATPEQLAAIIKRDWDRALVELKGSVYDQLVERGVTEEEASAVLAQDWPLIEERSKVRLTELVTQETDVNGDLVRAVLDGDWDTALEHIEVEVLEYVLNHLVV